MHKSQHNYSEQAEKHISQLDCSKQTRGAGSLLRSRQSLSYTRIAAVTNELRIYNVITTSVPS
jgi:hypothetical protein